MFRVRPFEERDRRAVAAIYRECRSEATWLPATAKESDFARDTEGEALLVAVGNDDEPEGFVSVWEPDAFIHHLYVRARSRQKGIGTQLLESLRPRLPMPWRLKCLRANESALAFYLRQGWLEVSSGDGEDGPYAVLEKAPPERTAVDVYIRAKDENRPGLMKMAFAEDATLEMVVNSSAITFPPFTQGLSAITDVLVTRFNESNENVRTFCLGDPPRVNGAAFSCAWLVGMSQKATGEVRVGCGTYDWSFQPQEPHLATRLRITIEVMEVLPPQHLAAVVGWLSALPYPWCDANAALRSAPRIERLEPIIRHLVS